MKICIPTMDDEGLHGIPSDHFGSAPFFTFVDTDSEGLDIQRNGGAHHVHGACRPLELLGTRDVEAVVCRGLGKRAFSRLRDGGIGVFVTLEKDVEATARAYMDGRLRQLTSEEACHGHSHGFGGGPGHVHGDGDGLGLGRSHTSGSGMDRGRGRGRGHAYGHENG